MRTCKPDVFDRGNWIYEHASPNCYKNIWKLRKTLQKKNKITENLSVRWSSQIYILFETKTSTWIQEGGNKTFKMMHNTYFSYVSVKCAWRWFNSEIKKAEMFGYVKEVI